ncbi:MAG: alanine racemase [Candidatus Omnitrophota bacterium]
MNKGRAWVEVDLNVIKANLNVIRNLVSPAGVLACVKANAYGLGADKIAPVLKDKVAGFAVATVGEALELRRAGIKKEILVLGVCSPEEVPAGLVKSLAFTAVDFEHARTISKIAAKLKKTARLHLKVDTGMGRLGINPEDLKKFYLFCTRLPFLKVTGIYTHFPVAETRNSFTLRQIRTFQKVSDPLRRGYLIRHAANSAAILNYPESWFDLVRAGIALYGVGSLLKSVVTLGSRLVFVKEVKTGGSVSYGRYFRARKRTKVATVSIGYADGYSRSLSNIAEVLVSGQRCPVIGAVCMDMTMVDVTNVPEVKVGDEVILIGKQKNGEIKVEEVADWAKTVPHEILSRLGPRITRLYHG